MRFEHEINQLQKLDQKLFLLLNSREVNIVDIAKKTIDLKVEFSEHNITSIHATKDYLFFGDTFSHLYAVKVADMFRDDPKMPVLKKQRLLGHEGWILSMLAWEDFLLTCSDDKTIKVWHMPSFKIKDELVGHKNGITCLTVANDHFYTGSYDLTIRSWNIAEMKDRILLRERLVKEEEYSIKAEAYQTVLDTKRKKKKKGTKKSASKSPAKSKATKTK
jgi:WD40 repeat protein